MTAPGVIIAAPSSGSGKTVVTLGLLRALARRGVAVASAKVGPDYIDPAFHTAASGRPCLNLDPWAMRPATLRARIGELSAAALVVCEGVMGLFDGADVPAGQPCGSTAEVAALSGWPVVLLVDVRGQAASVAALVQGFTNHRADVRVEGVIFNRVGSASHRAIIERAMTAACPGLPLLGWLPRSTGLSLPERHLGLVQAGEQAQLESLLDQAAGVIEDHLEIERLMALARPSALDFSLPLVGRAGAGDAGASPPTQTSLYEGQPAAGSPTPNPSPQGGGAFAVLPPLGQHIAIARDCAFAFAYPAVLDGWRRQGAELSFFSPLADQAPDASADAVYLPGGYPELHAGRLALAHAFRHGLHAAVARGAWIYGECGGFMALGDALEDAEGVRHPMAGLLPLVTSFAQRRLHLGYRRATTLTATPFGPAGSGLRGHEFHYSTILRQDGGQALLACTDAAGRDLPPAGLAVGRVLGSYLHLVDHEA